MDACFPQEERKASFLSNSPLDPKQWKWTRGEWAGISSILFLFSQPLGLSPAAPQGQPKPCLWLTHSRDFSCLRWDGGNQPEPRLVGIVARGGRQSERSNPGRGVTLAGACCSVGTLSRLCTQLGEGKGERNGIQGSDCSGVRREGVAATTHHSQAQLGLLLGLCCAAEDCLPSCPLTLNTPHGQAHGKPKNPSLNHRNTQSWRSITSSKSQA